MVKVQFSDVKRLRREVDFYEHLALYGAQIDGNPRGIHRKQRRHQRTAKDLYGVYFHEREVYEG